MALIAVGTEMTIEGGALAPAECLARALAPTERLVPIAVPVGRARDYLARSRRRQPTRLALRNSTGTPLDKDRLVGNRLPARWPGRREKASTALRVTPGRPFTPDTQPQVGDVTELVARRPSGTETRGRLLR